MPGRKFPLITDQIYHIFNRGINRQPTFTDKRDYQRSIESMMYYRYSKPQLKLSRFIRLDAKDRLEALGKLEKHNKLIEIISYCLMPNHFHLLLKQLEEGGISKFLSNFQNSYTRFFNTKHERDGSLFLDQFKAVIIETDEQLLHVSRYIHLNPYTSYMVKSMLELEKFAWSSLHDYLGNKKTFIYKDLIINTSRSVSSYRQFVLDRADYQRRLGDIKHLLIE